MTGSETKQRVEAFVSGAIYHYEMGYLGKAPDDIGGENLIFWILQQPGAIEAGKLTVDTTMFNITLANLPAGFKGINGTLGTKFKVFLYNQMIQETDVVYNQFKGLESYDDNKLKRNYENFARYLSMGIDMIPGFNVVKIKMIPSVVKKLNKLLGKDEQIYIMGENEQQYAKLMLVRLNIAALGGLGMEIEIIKSIYNTVAKFGGYKMTNGITRGGSSVLFSMLFLMLVRLPGAILAGDIDEDEELLDDLAFNLMPVYMNVWYRMHKGQSWGEATSEAASIITRPYRDVFNTIYEAGETIIDGF